MHKPSAVPFAVLQFAPKQLTKAEAELAKARAEASRARGLKRCGSDCRTKLAAEAAANADVDAAKWELLSAESKATTDSPLQAPTWLLPAALDVVAFMAIWTGLTGHRPGQARKPVRLKRRGAAAKLKPSAPKFRHRANDNTNVVPVHAA